MGVRIPEKNKKKRKGLQIDGGGVKICKIICNQWMFGLREIRFNPSRGRHFQVRSQNFVLEVEPRISRQI